MSLFDDPMPPVPARVDPVALADEIWRRWREHPRARVELSPFAREVATRLGRWLAVNPNVEIGDLAREGCLRIDDHEITTGEDVDPVERSRLAQQLAAIGYQLAAPRRRAPAPVVVQIPAAYDTLPTYSRKSSPWDDVPEWMIMLGGALVFALVVFGSLALTLSP